MAKINLMPDVKQERIKTKRRNFFVTITAIVILAATILALIVMQGYKWALDYNLARTKEDISRTNDELKNYADIEQTVTNIEQGLQAINQVSSSEPRWSLFLPQLEKVTPNDVQYTQFSQEGNTFKASAVGKSVVSIARTIKALENYTYQKDKSSQRQKLFNNVVVTGYSKDENGNVKFDISFDLKQGVLW